MDLMQENPIPTKKENKGNNTGFKVALIFVIVLIVLLIIVAACLWMYGQSLQERAFKVVIDGVLNNKASDEEGIFLIKNEKVYTSIEDICKFVGYNFYRGGYRQYTEDRTKCYINNSKEIVYFSSGSKEIVKYTTNVNDLPQNFEIDEEVFLQQGDRLYISEQGLEKAFNLVFDYNVENNTVNIQTLPYLTTYYEKMITNASIDKSNFGDDVKFNNAKAILRNLIVIKDPNTSLYGVGILNSSKELSTIITQRYLEVEYMEGSDDFIVTTEEKKVGIIGSDGITKVKPDYDTIEIIDKNIGLYLVSNSNKQSVININGKIIVHQDYDTIGLSVNSYESSVVTNRYLLLDNCIPVKLNNKWGLINKNGDTVSPLQYDGIGCMQLQNVQAKNTYGIVVVPEINGIVIEVDSQIGSGQNSKVKKYGIIDATTGELVVNTVLDSVYSVTAEEVTTYYMTAGGQEFNIIEWWREQYADAENASSSENTTQNDNQNNVQSGDQNNTQNNEQNGDQNDGQNDGQNGDQNNGQNDGQDGGQSDGQGDGQNGGQDAGQGDGQNGGQDAGQNDGQNGG